MNQNAQHAQAPEQRKRPSNTPRELRQMTQEQLDRRLTRKLERLEAHENGGQGDLVTLLPGELAELEVDIQSIQRELKRRQRAPRTIRKRTCP